MRVVEEKLAFAHASFQGACMVRLSDFTRLLAKFFFSLNTMVFGRRLVFLANVED